MTKHSKECLAVNMGIKRIHDEWVASWPKYCQTCVGTGELVYPGDCVPYGSTTARLPDNVEPCPDCTEKGICARCGGMLADAENGNGPCLVCGWNHDDECPIEYLDGPCECEIEEMQAADRDYSLLELDCQLYW